MTLVYALRLMCDLYYYLTAIGFIGLLGGYALPLLFLPLTLGIGAGLSYRYGKKNLFLRYAFLALGLIVPAIGCTVVLCLLSLPALVYSVMYVRGNRKACDYYFAFDRFRYGLPLMLLPFLIGAVTDGSYFAQTVPVLLLHLILSITVLRMLRHDDRILEQRRFQVLNLLSVGAVLIAGVVMSSEWMLARLKELLGLFYRFAILPVLELLLLCLKGIGYVLEWLFSWVEINGKPIDLQIGDNLSAQELFGDVMEGVEENAGNPLIQQLIKAGAIAVGVVVAFFLLRLLSRQLVRDPDVKSREERESLEDDMPKEGGLRSLLRRRNDPVLGVRYVYKKYLRQAEAHGVTLTGRQNSLQVKQASEATYEEAPLDELREVYIRARYDADATSEDVKAAKDALGRLKRIEK